MNKIDFMNRIRVVKNKDEEIVSYVKNVIDNNDLTIENVEKITERLSDKQKEMLKELYLTQISNLENNIEKCKIKIKKLKSNKY